MKKVIDGKTYWEDAKGGLTLEDNVKPVDILRDQVVTDIFDKAKVLQDSMLAVKKAAMENINEFVNLCAEKYDVKLGGQKGNLTLVSYDGSIKIVVSYQDSLDFNEHIEIAKKLIYDCISAWSDGSNKNLVALVDRAFRVTNGRLDVKRILDLRQINIEDPNWAKAMEAINDSISIRSSKQYFRVFTRNTNGDYERVNLDMSDIQ